MLEAKQNREQTRCNIRRRLAIALSAVVMAAIAAITASTCAAQSPTEITLPGTRVFPESLTSSSDGTLIVGSLGHGNVLRIAPGSTTAEEWIKPGTAGLNSLLGVFADEKAGLLWVCSNHFNNKGEATAAKTFDLKTGAPKNSYNLPGDDPLCNDFAIAADGTAYISDTNQAAIFMLKPGAKALVQAAKDPLLEGADGLAFGDDSALYVNSVTKNKLVRLAIGKDGKATSVTELKLPRAVDRPDGMRAVGKNRMLMAENGGIMSLVTVNGDDVKIQNLKEGLPATPGVTATRGMAWIVEGKLNLMDEKYKDQDPGTFKLYAVPLPK
jgi:sugar lactone lactonase YvrE